jgi:hypothetical protein
MVVQMPKNALLPVVLGALLGCSRQQTADPTPASPSSGPAPSAVASASVTPDPASPDDPALPPTAKPCPGGKGVTCTTFDTAEDAFRWILALDPAVLAVGEAHAQKGTEDIASSTKRFTDSLLPLLSGKASDVIVELWAPDPKCKKEVAVVASAQKPVTTAQAATNQNEYVTLGTKAKEKGMTPWLLRPTCDDFTMLADAGADIGAMLGLVKRLTEDKLVTLHEKSPSKIVVAYGGAMHNDITPDPAMKEYSFGPDMVKAHGKRYVELDLIVPEYVKDTPIWQKLPWYAPFKAQPGPRATSTLYRLGERSFVLLFPSTTK